MQEEKVFLWLETGERTENHMELTVRPLHWAGTGGNICLILTGPDGYRLEQKAALTEGVQEAVFQCPGVKLWDPEHPDLYHAIVTMNSGEALVASHETDIGFRTIEKKGKKLFWNHKPLKLKGICYRERIGDMEGTKKDLEQFARANVNFLRSIYGPFSNELLNLCDEIGFLVENTAPFYEIGQTKAAIQDLPHCRDGCLTPVREMMENGCHVSVLIWSLGHDCAWGANFREAADYIRSIDRIRPLTFHLPMSIPEEEEQMDIWPVHYIDWKQPFDVCFDQMVIFHTPGADNEVGYMTGQAEYEVPVLHEVWSPVACHNRDEIRQDPAIRRFWGESIHRFAEKSYRTEGCLGGAVLAGVDEDGSFEGMDQYEWGILDRQHNPKPEYEQLKSAYAPILVRISGLEEEELLLETENRFLFTDLSEYRLMIDGREWEGISLCGEPGSVTRYRIRRDELLSQKKEGTVFGKAMKDGKELGITFVSKTGGRDYTCIVPVKQDAEPRPLTEKKSLDPLVICHGTEGEDADRLIISNHTYEYRFSKKTCLLEEASAGGRKILAGGPFLNSAGLLLGNWIGTDLTAKESGDRVQVTITGSYKKVLDIRFRLLIAPDGGLDTSYEVLKLYRHMPHTVKANIGIAPGGLNEKGAAYLLKEGIKSYSWTFADLQGEAEAWHRASCCGCSKEEAEAAQDKDLWSSRHHIRRAAVTDTNGYGVEVLSDGSDSVRLERAPQLTPEAVVDDRDIRMHFTGSWHRMDDYCGNYAGTETLSKEAGDSMSFTFTGTGVRLYGPYDINYGMCDIYLDGEAAAQNVSQYLGKVDFPGLSRGYEKRYGQLLFEVRDLPEKEHELVVKVLGKAPAGAQSTYTAIDYAVIEGSRYPEGIRMNVNQDYNYTRLVRGCYKRPKAELIPGVREHFGIRLIKPFA